LLLASLVGVAGYPPAVSSRLLPTLNWSGAVYNEPGAANWGVVAGMMTAPTVRPNPAGPPQPHTDQGGGADAWWVGLGGADGDSTDHLCQAGIVAVEQPDGRIAEHLVAEDYPHPPVQGAAVHPGDAILALAGILGPVPYAAALDATTGQTVATACTLPPRGGWDSVEAIEEAPAWSVTIDGRPAIKLEPVLDATNGTAQTVTMGWAVGLSHPHGWPKGLAAQAPSLWISALQPPQTLNMVWPAPADGSWNGTIVSATTAQDGDKIVWTWHATPYSAPPALTTPPPGLVLPPPGPIGRASGGR